eukprot:scaffold115120_cov31-Tisochrysis_lutea.AAC.3
MKSSAVTSQRSFTDPSLVCKSKRASFLSRPPMTSALPIASKATAYTRSLRCTVAISVSGSGADPACSPPPPILGPAIRATAALPAVQDALVAIGEDASPRSTSYRYALEFQQPTSKCSPSPDQSHDQMKAGPPTGGLARVERERHIEAASCEQRRAPGDARGPHGLGMLPLVEQGEAVGCGRGHLIGGGERSIQQRAAHAVLALAAHGDEVPHHVHRAQELLLRWQFLKLRARADV